MKDFLRRVAFSNCSIDLSNGQESKKVRAQKGQEVHTFCNHSTFLALFFHFLPAVICKRWNGKLWTKTYNPLQLHSYYISKMCTPCSIRNALYNSIYIVIFETFILLYYSLKNVMILQKEMTTISGSLLIVRPFIVWFLKNINSPHRSTEVYSTILGYKYFYKYSHSTTFYFPPFFLL